MTFFFLSLAHGSSVGPVQRVEAHAPQGAELTTLVLARSESSRRSGQFRNCYPKNMKQEPRRIHGAGPRSGLGVGCRRRSRSRKLRGLSLHAQARRRSISLTHHPMCFAQGIQANHLTVAAEGRRTQSAAGPRIASYKAAKR